MLINKTIKITEVVKLVDTLGLGSNSQENGGSSPFFGISHKSV